MMMWPNDYNLIVILAEGWRTYAGLEIRKVHKKSVVYEIYNNDSCQI